MRLYHLPMLVMSNCRQGFFGQVVSPWSKRFLWGALILICLGLPGTASGSSVSPQEDPLKATEEIRYQMPEASEVFLVWGINGWQVAPQEVQPAGTLVQNGEMRTPMTLEGDTFVARLTLPAGTEVNYGFLITKNREGEEVNQWEADGDKDYLLTTTQQDGIVEHHSKLPLGQLQPKPLVIDAPLVNFEIRYQMPFASEVDLIWGVNGWNLMPEEARPEGTDVKGSIMYTPMVKEGDAFVARVQVPAGATVDYGFMTVKDASGNIVQVWEANGEGDFHSAISEDSTVQVPSQVTEDKVKAALILANAPPVTQGFRLRSPDAGEVYLVWGVNGWKQLPEEVLPAGTEARSAGMFTLMTKEGDTYVASLQVPSGTSIDYGFLTTKDKDGNQVDVWEANGVEDYHTTVNADGVVEVQSQYAQKTSLRLSGTLLVGVYLLIGLIVMLVVAFIYNRFSR